MGRDGQGRGDVGGAGGRLAEISSRPIKQHSRGEHYEEEEEEKGGGLGH